MSRESKIINVNVTFRNTEATDALKTYATDKIGSCLQKLVHQNTEAQVVLLVEKKRQIAEVSFRSDGADFQGSETSEDMYKSIDNLASSISAQLRKHKEKLTQHH